MSSSGLCSTELAVLGTLSWERIDIVNCVDGESWVGMNKEEIATVTKWMNRRIEQLSKKRDSK
jgi:hypothetical protein|tara:strand:+ start:132 stop:320 length:189 start_codon:yes stop_codon:yes gene_type:complete